MPENMTTTVSKCMDAVRQHVGTVELEMFIYYIRSQAFDYTQWQREHYDGKKPEEIFEMLETYSNNHQFAGKKARII